jgi:hypothetical protein
MHVYCSIKFPFSSLQLYHGLQLNMFFLCMRDNYKVDDRLSYIFFITRRMFIASVACINQFHGLRTFCSYDVSFPLFLDIYISACVTDTFALRAPITVTCGVKECPLPAANNAERVIIRRRYVKALFKVATM